MVAGPRCSGAHAAPGRGWHASGRCSRWPSIAVRRRSPGCCLGLWSLVYGLGVFASYRLLPPQVFWVGSYYVLCGCGCLVWGQGEHAFSPWQMGVSFGGGQMLGAATLY